jgi:hypothetical protein
MASAPPFCAFEEKRYTPKRRGGWGGKGSDQAAERDDAPIAFQPVPPVDAAAGNARLGLVEVVLRKLGKGSRAVAGRLVRAPRKGSVVVIEFPDGMHEYVTTPVKRVLRLAGREVFYIETINSRYRLEVRGREDAVAESAG